MRCEIEGVNVYASWEHNRNVDGSGGLDPRGGKTVCELSVGEAITKAAAECSPLDPYNKQTGRKLSLGRALRIAGVPRKTRLQVWQKFLLECEHLNIDDEGQVQVEEGGNS